MYLRNHHFSKTYQISTLVAGITSGLDIPQKSAGAGTDSRTISYTAREPRVGMRCRWWIWSISLALLSVFGAMVWLSDLMI